jgi:DNA (cytosine-5)-methyltransferase 1
MVYYNEFDPACCEWLRELMKAGLIPRGDIDGRSITEVRASDVRGYDQCHFFAGIGGWSEALRLAGQSNLRCWTGSCPCPSFSSAGKGLGFADPRHLWPQFFNLIRECKPAIVLGEQVEAAINYGWLDLVSADLESEGYAVGSVVLGAHSVQAPHKRQRLYWAGAMGHRDDVRQLQGEGRNIPVKGSGELASGEPGETGKLVVTASERLGGGCEDSGDVQAGLFGARLESFWSDCDWLPCRDGKSRPVEPGTFPLANGVPRSLELLRGYGNAIVPQVAAEFIKALILPTPKGGGF